MPLIKDNDIVTLRKYVKMAFTATAENSMPDMDKAERKFLIPIITQSVYDNLQAQVTNNNITWVALLNLCRAAVAPLAVYLDLPFMQASIGDTGIKTTSSDNMQAAHQWEYREIKDALLNNGMAALEDLLVHLIANGNTYAWSNDAAKESFIRTGNDFSQYIFISQPNLTFQQIRPLMKEVEDHFIKPSIGEDFFKLLRDKQSPTTAEKKAIELIKKTIAQYTVVRATERLTVRITANGLMATLQSNTEVVSPEQPANNTAVERLKQAAQREGDSYHTELMQYLNNTASSTIFPTFFASEYYTAPSAPVDRNATRTGVCSLL